MQQRDSPPMTSTPDDGATVAHDTWPPLTSASHREAASRRGQVPSSACAWQA